MRTIRDALWKALRAAVAVSATVFLASVLVGCRNPDTATTFGQSVWGNFKETKTYLGGYKHVVLVCVYEDYWQDRGPHEYSFHHFKSTVVRVDRGNWQPSERLAFVHGVDSPAKSAVNAHAGELLYVFTNEHTSNEFGVDAGEFLGYDPEIDRQLRLVFSKQNGP
jgi:hypothetical protein